MRPINAFLVTIFWMLTASAALAAGPDEQLFSLLQTLQSRKYDGALTTFFSGSLTAKQKGTELKAMEGQVKAALEFYGPPRSWEIVESKALGKDLINLKLLSKHNDDVPLFWNALFYRRKNTWEPLGVYFFDDPRKAGFF